MPYNNLRFTTNLFVNLEYRHVEKIGALKCYKSQFLRKYADEDFIRSLAKVRGIQIGIDCAECFEVIRWII